MSILFLLSIVNTLYTLIYLVYGIKNRRAGEILYASSLVALSAALGAGALLLL